MKKQFYRLLLPTFIAFSAVMLQAGKDELIFNDPAKKSDIIVTTYVNMIKQAQKVIIIDNNYCTSNRVLNALEKACKNNPSLLVIIVVDKTGLTEGSEKRLIQLSNFKKFYVVTHDAIKAQASSKSLPPLLHHKIIITDDLFCSGSGNASNNVDNNFEMISAPRESVGAILEVIKHLSTIIQYNAFVPLIKNQKKESITEALNDCANFYLEKKLHHDMLEALQKNATNCIQLSPKKLNLEDLENTIEQAKNYLGTFGKDTPRKRITRTRKFLEKELKERREFPISSPPSTTHSSPSYSTISPATQQALNLIAQQSTHKRKVIDLTTTPPTTPPPYSVVSPGTQEAFATYSTPKRPSIAKQLAFNK